MPDETPARLELDRLLNEIDDIAYIDHPRVLLLAKQAQTLAEDIGDVEGLGRALNYQAWSWTDTSRFDQSTALSMQAIELAQSHGLPAIEARALNILSANFQYARDYANASQLLERHREIAEQLDDDYLRTLALNDQGNLHIVLGAPAQGLELIQRALALAPRTRHRGVLHGSIYLTLSEAYLALGQHKQAMESIQQATEIFRHGSDNVDLAYAWSLLGNIYLSLSQYKQARTYLEQARILLEDLPVPRITVMNLLFSAALLSEQGDLMGAAQEYERALDLTRQHDLLDFQVEAYQGLFQISRKRGDLDSALRYQELRQQATDAASFRKLDQRLEILKTIYGAGRSRYADALSQLNEATPSAAESERHMEEAKQEILQRLSHEFRTPLAVIRSGADLLTRYHDRMNEEQRLRHLDRIGERVTWMTSMLDDILLLLQLNHAERALTPQPVQLQEIVAQAMEKLSAMSGQPERVEINMMEDPPEVMLDGELLREIIVQLVDNALKFSQESVDLKLRIADQLEITVGDSGIGIPPDEVDRIHEVFYRASNLDEVGGRGIGLALVDQAVTVCGGHWHIDSLLDVGTRVVVTLPLADRSAMTFS